MLAFIAAIIFLVDLIFKPHSVVNLLVLGLFFIALHLALGDVTALWRRRP